jgi:hypothetical protein
MFFAVIFALIARILFCFFYIYYAKWVSNQNDPELKLDAYARLNIELYDIPYYLFHVTLCSLGFSWASLYGNLKMELEKYENPAPDLMAERVL